MRQWATFGLSNTSGTISLNLVRVVLDGVARKAEQLGHRRVRRVELIEQPAGAGPDRSLRVALDPAAQAPRRALPEVRVGDEHARVIREDGGVSAILRNCDALISA